MLFLGLLGLSPKPPMSNNTPDRKSWAWPTKVSKRFPTDKKVEVLSNDRILQLLMSS
uniref:Uncharacterized protein n=1 Tax=Arundo donax TaxID=35708 RepID=A0A0A9AY97_ARUDO